MVKDRLPQLLSQRKESHKKRKISKGNDLQLDHTLFKRANELYNIIDELKRHVADVETIHRNILASPNNDTELDEQLNHLNRTVKDKIAYVQENIKIIETNINEKDTLLPSTQERMRKAQHAALTKTFLDTLQLYNKCQLEYREKCKSRIYGILSVAGHTFTDDQVENMLGKKTPEIFTQFVMQDTEAAKRSLSDIEARHTDLMQVEESIKELQYLFVTFAAIIEQQSQLVDRIENNITRAAASVTNADKELKAAENSQKKSRRCRIICIAVGVVLGLILLVSILSAIGLT